jgi:transglutaminase-like putative cysteine protease
MNRPARYLDTLPLTSVCAGVGLATLPLLGKVVGWVAWLLFAALLAQLLLHRRSRRLPSLPVKLLLFGLGVGAIAVTFGTLIGPEAGLSVLLLLVALKVLETKTARDFQVLALLGYFLCLCGLFFAQELLLWLFLAGIVVLLTMGLIAFHRAGGGLARSLRLSFILLLQALPVTALLFVFFPRGYSGYRFQFSRSILGNQGISDRLEPGSIAALAQSDAIVFRAEFPDGTIPSSEDMYWRGAVLWRSAGLTWTRGPQLSLERRTGQLGGPPIKQRISLQPHGERWIFALDRPAGDLRTAPLQPGGYLQSVRPIFNTFHYTIESQPENRETRLPLDQVETAQALPAQLSPEAKALAASWTATAASGREIVAAGLRYFRTERFSYTLEPGTYGENGLDEFLFKRRTGFCEHYAAAFATLMRAAGLPSRIVVGYHGGQYNSLGHYVIVRQYHAHAWCEVWLPNYGWLRVDPTDAIAPERVSASFGPLREGSTTTAGAAGGGTNAASWWRSASNQAGLAWDSINYRWDLHVQNYDEDQQRTLLARLGFARFSWLGTLLWSGLAVLVLLAIVALWLRRPTRFRGDAVSRGYERLCRRLATAGVAREPWEGPLGFTERAALAFPQHAALLHQAGQLYAAIRYARTPPETREFVAIVRGLPEFARLSPAPAPASMPAPR